jgi:hypothetical protein
MVIIAGFLYFLCVTTYTLIKSMCTSSVEILSYYINFSNISYDLHFSSALIFISK